jgi:SAM-dependent methyltransferase
MVITFSAHNRKSRNPRILELNEKIIKNAAKEKLDPNNPILVILKQAFYEKRAKIRTKTSFRSRANDKAVDAYCRMNFKEFDGINARQRWANWRTVPRNLNGRLPLTEVKCIDLCSGVGQSTEVLAYYLPKGSEILGLEYNPDFVEMAKDRQYVDAQGDRVKVAFRAQSVLETFLDAKEQPIEDASVDLVNCCGAVGHHFDPRATRVLAQEVARVLKKGGLALIDSGKKGTKKEDVIRIFSALGFQPQKVAKSWVADQNAQICFRKG